MVFVCIVVSVLGVNKSEWMSVCENMNNMSVVFVCMWCVYVCDEKGGERKRRENI